MPKIEKKIIKNKPFYYLSEQIYIGEKYKKIQVYLGKNIPKDLSPYYNKLQNKEIKMISRYINRIFLIAPTLDIDQYQKIESLRIRWKYKLLSLPEKQQEELWRGFAIQFIFESNAIEGSRLSRDEVKAIIKKKYIKKSIARKEIDEVNNAIKAFALIRDKAFKLNQRSIIKLHQLTTAGLGIEPGYKKVKITVNNKETIPPGEVRSSMAKILTRLQDKKKSREHPFLIAADFHSRFEFIHPFVDGNGRVGRLIFNWMLWRAGYGAILFKNRNRQAYFSALHQADEGRRKKWHWHCVRTYKKTMRDLLAA